jgi:hypothetical protein
VLCRGTAIALQLGHRTSIDLDFIASHGFDPDELYSGLPFLSGSKVIQKSANTLTCDVHRGESVQVSFFGTSNLRLTTAPLIAADNGLAVASLVDLAGMKAAVVQKRAEARDGNLATLPREVQDRLVAAVRAVNLEQLPLVRQRRKLNREE